MDKIASALSKLYMREHMHQTNRSLKKGVFDKKFWNCLYTFKNSHFQTKPM